VGRAGVGHRRGRIELDAAVVERLRAFFELLRAASATQNLTRVASEEDVVERHALDALLGLSMLPDDTASFVDIGAGGGVPGIPLALARPAWRALLLESSGARRSSSARRAWRSR